MQGQQSISYTPERSAAAAQKRAARSSLWTRLDVVTCCMKWNKRRERRIHVVYVAIKKGKANKGCLERIQEERSPGLATETLRSLLA